MSVIHNNTEMEESNLLKLNGDVDNNHEYKVNIYNNIQYSNINNNNLEEEIIFLKNKIQELEQKLKKYTNGDNHKRYYEKNKEKIKKDGLSYLKKLKLENPDKIKEYNHNSYIKRKEKKKNLENNAPQDK